MTVLITGGSGFIGTNLALYLLSKGQDVRVIDENQNFRSQILQSRGVHFQQLDLRRQDSVTDRVFQDVSIIYHLAADVDNRFSWDHPHNPLEANVGGTLNLALAARNFQVPEIVYASTGTIYGDHKFPPFREDFESSAQSTLYGATKYAGEGILSVFSTHFDISIRIFRFVGVLGPYCNHGHLYDFFHRLKQNPEILEVLGNGYQKKSYVHVDDLIRGITSIRSTNRFDVYNLGRPDYSTVRDSVKWLIEEWGINPKVTYEEKDAGWVGDNPFLQLNVEKAYSKGWVPEISIEESVKETVRWLIENS